MLFSEVERAFTIQLKEADSKDCLHLVSTSKENDTWFVCGELGFRSLELGSLVSKNSVNICGYILTIHPVAQSSSATSTFKLLSIGYLEKLHN